MFVHVQGVPCGKWGKRVPMWQNDRQTHITESTTFPKLHWRAENISSLQTGKYFARTTLSLLTCRSVVFTQLNNFLLTLHKPWIVIHNIRNIFSANRNGVLSWKCWKDLCVYVPFRQVSYMQIWVDPVEARSHGLSGLFKIGDEKGCQNVSASSSLRYQLLFYISEDVFPLGTMIVYTHIQKSGE